MHLRTILAAIVAVSLIGTPAAHATPGTVAQSVDEFSGTSPDGIPWWGTSTTIELSTGDIGQTYLLVRGDGSGAMYFAINDQVVSATSIEAATAVRDDDSGLEVSSWSPNTLDYAPELVAELMRASPSATLINGAVPQEFKCSPFGKKAVKGAKYLWYAATGALAAACCASSGPGCILCAAGSAAAGAAGGDTADGYCD